MYMYSWRMPLPCPSFRMLVRRLFDGWVRACENPLCELVLRQFIMYCFNNETQLCTEALSDRRRKATNRKKKKKRKKKKQDKQVHRTARSWSWSMLVVRCGGERISKMMRMDTAE